MRFVPQSKEPLFCLIAWSLMLLGGFWWMCRYDDDVNFLIRHGSRDGSAEWILKDHPRIMPVRDQIEESTTFRRTFTLDHVDPEAVLKLRAFKHCKLRLNDSILWDADLEHHWKEAIILQIGKWLKPGLNEFEVTVFNWSGPPALWLEMMNGPLTIVSDASWECSAGGILWSPPRLADTPMADRIAEPVDFLNPMKSMGEKLPKFLLWSAISLAVVLTGRWLLKQLTLHWALRNAALILTGIAAFSYFLLMLHNMDLLPDFYGFDGDGHKDYITFIQDHHKLPLASAGWQMYQPPLYYLICAGLLSAFHLLISQHAGVVLVRFLGCAEAMLILFLVMGGLRILFPRMIGAQVVGLLFAAALPPVLYLSHYITNELMAALWISAAILCCLNILRQSVVSVGMSLLLGLFLGLALLSKSSAVVALPVVEVTLLLWLRQSSRSLPRDWLMVIGLPLIALLLTCGWHYWRVFTHFGSPFIGNWSPLSGNHWWQDEGYRIAAWYSGFGQVFRTPFLGSYGGFYNGLYATLFGDSLAGGQTDLLHRPPWDYESMGSGYFLALVPLLLIVTGLVVQSLRFLRLPSLEWFLMLGLGVAYAFLLLFMTVVGPTWSSAKSFYALQALLPLCAFAAAGWEWFKSQVGKIGSIVIASLVGLWVINCAATYWIDPKSTQTALMRGVGYGIASEWSKARLEMARAVRDHPDSPEALLLLGFADSALGDTNSAEKNYLAALKSNPSDAQIHVLLAGLLEQSGRTAESIDHLRQALLLEPELPDAYNEMARFLMTYDGTSIEKSKEALGMALRGCELTLYRNPVAMFGLADAYSRVGNQELALKTGSEARRTQGDILTSQNNTEGAVNEYRQALQIDPANLRARRNLDQAMTRMNNRSLDPQ